MFERYTERARRIIFFARYEASQFGSPSIESEHLLLGLLREDRSVDLPLTTESKHILAYANEEAENLGHRHIDTPHLMLGMLRESGSLAANILLERQVNIQTVRAAANSTKSAPTPSQSPPSPSSSSPMKA